MISLNKDIFNKDYLTDIISLNHAQPPNIQGELFIALKRVKHQAKQYKHSHSQELKFVLAHGILHLLGDNDHTPELRQKMWQDQHDILKACQ